jgi:hypothetical protein
MIAKVRRRAISWAGDIEEVTEDRGELACKKSRGQETGGRGGREAFFGIKAGEKQPIRQV